MDTGIMHFVPCFIIFMWISDYLVYSLSPFCLAYLQRDIQKSMYIKRQILFAVIFDDSTGNNYGVYQMAVRNIIPYYYNGISFTLRKKEKTWVRI